MSRPTLLDKIEWTAQKRAGLQVSGDHTARVTPVPIPNTEVKPRRADDTARATMWERRSSPGFKIINGQVFLQNIWPFCLLCILFCYCDWACRFFACPFLLCAGGAKYDRYA